MCNYIALLLVLVADRDREDSQLAVHKYLFIPFYFFQLFPALLLLTYTGLEVLNPYLEALCPQASVPEKPVEMLGHARTRLKSDRAERPVPRAGRAGSSPWMAWSHSITFMWVITHSGT